MIGDSIAQNANFAHIEKQTKSRIRTVKAYSSSCDSKARWPQKNVTDVTSVALASCHKGDEFSYLVLAAPTVNITNLDTSQVEQLDNIEVFKQKVVVSCQNIFYVAHNALSKPFNTLKQVVIMEHLNRHDVSDVDPTELKPKLAKFANATFARLWNSSAMKASTTLTPMVGVSMPTELEGMMGYICMCVIQNLHKKRAQHNQIYLTNRTTVIFVILLLLKQDLSTSQVPEKSEQ